MFAVGLALVLIGLLLADVIAVRTAIAVAFGYVCTGFLLLVAIKIATRGKIPVKFFGVRL